MCIALGQARPQPANATSAHPHGSISNRTQKIDRTLTPDDRLALIAAALDARDRQDSVRDCSHLVHAIYEQAGFAYAYASSTDLYSGVEGFQRTTRPQPVIWWYGAGTSASWSGPRGTPSSATCAKGREWMTTRPPTG